MADRLIEDLEAQPSTKSSKGKKVAGVLAGVAILGVVAFLSMVKSNKDPKRIAAASEKVSRSEASAAGQAENQSSSNRQLNSDGSLNQAGADVMSDFKRKQEADVRAREEAEARLKEKKTQEDQKKGNPRSIDPETGRPRDPAEPVLPVAPKWDPEHEVFVSGAGTPAYRYTPAYIRGANIPYDQATVMQWDQRYLASAQGSSFGKSIPVTERFTAAVGAGLTVNQRHSTSAPIRMKAGDAPIRQPETPTVAAKGQGDYR